MNTSPTFVTLVHGPNVLAAMCNTLVLGQALREISPSSTRLVLIADDLDATIASQIGLGKTWEVKKGSFSDAYDRKAALFTLPSSSAMYIDNDILPLMNAKRLDEMWKQVRIAILQSQRLTLKLLTLDP